MSLGGQASQHAAKYIVSQSYTASTIPGIEITHAARNTDGVGTLSYTAANGSIGWLNPDSVLSTILVSGDGWAVVGNPTDGYLRLSITQANLPGSDASQAITVAQARDSLFDSPAANELAAGVTDYRALYIANESAGAVTDVTLTLTDAAPQSTLALGSTFIPASKYSSTEAEALDFGVMNGLYGVAPYSTSVSGLFPRTALGAGPPMMTPGSSYYAQSAAQNSNGVDEDVEVQIQGDTDTTGELDNVEWGSSLFWTTIPAGRMVSFWVQRIVPAGPTIPTVEQALLDLDFTIS